VPIRWNALQVSEAADMIEDYIKQAAEPLEQARLVAREARNIPHLPLYIDECFSRLLGEIDRAIGGSQWEPVGRLKSAVDSIRQRIPADALEGQKATQHLKRLL